MWGRSPLTTPLIWSGGRIALWGLSRRWRGPLPARPADSTPSQLAAAAPAPKVALISSCLCLLPPFRPSLSLPCSLGIALGHSPLLRE